MGPRPNLARKRRRHRLLAFAVPALIAGVAILLITSGDDPQNPPGELGLGSSRISAVPPLDKAPKGGAPSGVRRFVTGEPGDGPATSGGVGSVEARPAVPVRIAIPSVGVDTSIVPVGATTDGIRVPPVYEAGWYDKGPRPSEPGRAIVLGHFDSLTGPAAFTQVPRAETGDEVIVTDEEGLTHTFRVRHTVELSKADFPAEEIYGATSQPSIALITCGGDFDPESGYENNVIVLAREVRSA